MNRANKAGKTVLLVLIVALLAALLGAGGMYAFVHLSGGARGPASTAAATATAGGEAVVATAPPVTPPAAGGSGTAPSSGGKTAPEEPPPAETGREFAFIRKMSAKSGTWYMTVDYAQWLTGDAAAKAAKAHGDESPPPNDYYVVNDNPKLRTFPVSDAATVQFKGPGIWKWAGESIPIDQFASGFNGSGPDVNRLKETYYWVVLKNGTITGVEEQWVP